MNEKEYLALYEDEDFMDFDDPLWDEEDDYPWWIEDINRHREEYHE
jgi:hypothetical protein